MRKSGESMRKMVLKRCSLACLLLASYLASAAFPSVYYVRMVHETSRDSFTMRSEEVYEQGNVKIVFVTSLESFVWVRVGDKYYIGSGRTLYRTFPIKDLHEIVLDYLRTKKIELTRDGTYRFVEGAVSFEITVVEREITKVVRRVGTVTTTMFISRFHKNFDAREILSRFTLVDRSPIPEDLYRVFALFLWSNVQEEGADRLRITGYDKAGAPLELEINKTSGEFKIQGYFLRIIRASEQAAKELRDALRGY